MADYRAYERDLMAIIATKFGLPPAMPMCVQRIDTAILLDERKALMKPPPMQWELGGEN
ncbi:MAG: hypothetical protein AAGB19_01560 [Cyanobacteria bacterium P01_F01_bin.3]